MQQSSRMTIPIPHVHSLPMCITLPISHSLLSLSTPRHAPIFLQMPFKPIPSTFVWLYVATPMSISPSFRPSCMPFYHSPITLSTYLIFTYIPLNVPLPISFLDACMAVQSSSKAFIKVPSSPIHVHGDDVHPTIILIPTSYQPPYTRLHIYPSFTPPTHCILMHFSLTPTFSH